MAGRRRFPAGRAAAAAGRWGKMERASRAFDSPTYLGLRWCVEAGPQAAADWRWRCSVWRRCRRSGVQGKLDWCGVGRRGGGGGLL
jgi:hypothetical protein